MNPITLITSRLGISRALAWVLLIIAAAVLIYFSLSLITWRHDAKEAAQAKLNNNRSAAQSEASARAIKTVVDAADREQSIDQAVAAADKEIRNAPDPVAARDAAVAVLCGMRAYSRDPACTVQPANP